MDDPLVDLLGQGNGATTAKGVNYNNYITQNSTNPLGWLLSQ